MVLREFDPDKRLIRFHTDFRSVKIEQLKKDSHAAIHGYDPNLKFRYDLMEKQTFITMMKSPKVLGNCQRRCQKNVILWAGRQEQELMILLGLILQLFDFESTNGFENFCVLVFQFESMEFLYLKKSGHRRAIHNWTTGEHQSSWLIP